jgi:hypothetical protein
MYGDVGVQVLEDDPNGGSHYDEDVIDAANLAIAI